jgi:hypothetical protein
MSYNPSPSVWSSVSPLDSFRRSSATSTTPHKKLRILRFLEQNTPSKGALTHSRCVAAVLGAVCARSLFFRCRACWSWPDPGFPSGASGRGEGCTARRLALVGELRKKTSPPLAHGFQELAAGEICRGSALATVHIVGTARQRVLLPRVDVDGFFFSLRAVFEHVCGSWAVVCCERVC